MPFSFFWLFPGMQPVKKQSVTKELPELETEDVGPDRSNVHIYAHPDLDDSGDESQSKTKTKPKNTVVSFACSCTCQWRWSVMSATFACDGSGQGSVRPCPGFWVVWSIRLTALCWWTVVPQKLDGCKMSLLKCSVVKHSDILSVIHTSLIALDYQYDWHGVNDCVWWISWVCVCV